MSYQFSENSADGSDWIKELLDTESIEVPVATENAESLIASPMDSYIDDMFITIAVTENAIIPKNPHNSSLFNALNTFPEIIDIVM